MTIRSLRLIISAATVVVLLVGTFSIQLGFGTGIGKAEAKSLTNASLSPTLSVSSNLANRRYAAAGDRAYDLGSEDGRFPAMGFHTRGEMGGIWTPPIKLLDGIWFGINGQWIGPATSFTPASGSPHMALPARPARARGSPATLPRGPRAAPVICPASGPDLFRCADTGFGKGAGGELTYTLKLHAMTSMTVWFTVAGSDQGLSAAQAEYQAASANPAGELQAKVASRLVLDSQTQVSLPGDPALSAAVTWSKHDLPHPTQHPHHAPT